MRSDRNELLSKVSHFSINLVSTNETTYSIQIMDCKNNEAIITLPLDPMDNTLAATISKESIAKLGDDAAVVLSTLSTVLRDHIGAKEFILMPQALALPQFTHAEDHGFKRLCHASRADLFPSISDILSGHPQLTLTLDKQYQTETGNPVNPQLALNLVNSHANFTEGKMTEYKEEERNGMRARLNNESTGSSVVTMWDNQPNLCGLIRCLGMGDGFAYLSDETINQNILPLADFAGKDEAEQSSNRSKYLLAYLANSLLKHTVHDHFVIIAASGREAIYEAIGFKAFPINANGYSLSIHLSAPQPLLRSIQDKLVKPNNSMIAGLFTPEVAADQGSESSEHRADKSTPL